jgi:hypothetical protein
MAIWRKQDVGFVLEEDTTDDPVATVHIDTPSGRLFAMAECMRSERTITLAGLHVHGDRTVANTVGPANLIVLAQAFMETMDVDELVVTGGLRTTGANPGKTPRPVRFARRPAAHLGG